MQYNLSPHFYAITSIVTGLLSFVLFDFYDIVEKYYFIPIFILAAAYALGNLYKQWHGESVFRLAENIVIYDIFKRAAARYLVWLSVLFLGYLFIQQHPYYSSGQYGRSLVFFDFYLTLYLVAGFPYFVITLLVKDSRVEDYYDPAIRIIHIIKSIIMRWRRDRPFYALSRPYNRKVLFNLIIRAYFLPVLIVQIYNSINMAVSAFSGNFHNYDTLSVILFITSLLLLMDATLGSMSYGIESRWLENRSRSVDLTAGGWLVCLSCYAPLNSATGTLFPFAPHVIDHNVHSLLFSGELMLNATMIIETVLLAILVYIGASLGPSVANVSLKKLQTRGAYSLVRHPAYTIKIVLWLVASLWYRKFWTYKYLFGQMMWTLIYILRALSEERHLKKYAEYRDYMKQVRYRFLPWLF